MLDFKNLFIGVVAGMVAMAAFPLLETSYFRDALDAWVVGLGVGLFVILLLVTKPLWWPRWGAFFETPQTKAEASERLKALYTVITRQTRRLRPGVFDQSALEDPGERDSDLHYLRGELKNLRIPYPEGMETSYDFLVRLGGAAKAGNVKWARGILKDFEAEWASKA